MGVVGYAFVPVIRLLSWTAITQFPVSFFNVAVLASLVPNSLNSRDLFLNLRRLVKMTKPLRFENKSLRLKYKCLICIWIIFWAILDLFINPKYLFQNKSFSQTYYFKSEKSFVILTSLLGLKINPGNLERMTPYTLDIFCSRPFKFSHILPQNDILV